MHRVSLACSRADQLELDSYLGSLERLRRVRTPMASAIGGPQSHDSIYRVLPVLVLLTVDWNQL